VEEEEEEEILFTVKYEEQKSYSEKVFLQDGHYLPSFCNVSRTTHAWFSLCMTTEMIFRLTNFRTQNVTENSQ
jgi:hypothetical protein